MKLFTFIVTLELVTLSAAADLQATSNVLGKILEKEEHHRITEAVVRQIPKHETKEIQKSPKKIKYPQLIEKASPKSKKTLQWVGEEIVDIIQSELRANNAGLWLLSDRRILVHKSPKIRGSYLNSSGVRRSLRFQEDDVKEELTNIDCEKELKKRLEKENFKRNLNNKRKAQESQLENQIEETKKLSPYATRKAVKDLAPLFFGFQAICEKIITFRLSEDFKKIKGLVSKRDAIVQKFYEIMPHEGYPDLIYKVIKSNHYFNMRERHFYVFKSDVIHLLDLIDENGRSNRQRLEMGLNLIKLVWHHLGQGVTSTEVILLISEEMHQEQHNGLHFNRKDSFVPRDGFNIDKKIMNQYLYEEFK